jgi:hypothetical protein
MRIKQKFNFAFNPIKSNKQINKQTMPNLISIGEVNDRFGRTQIHIDHATRLIIACDFFWMSE